MAVITTDPAAGHASDDQSLAAYSLPRPVGIWSAGSTMLTIDEIRFVGPGAADLSLDIATPCPREVEATCSCSFPIIFGPEAGNRSIAVRRSWTD